MENYPCFYKPSEADNWVYVAEGSLNLIVRYIGDNAIYKGKVLRVIKGGKGEHEKIDQSSAQFKQQFIEKVIQPLLGVDYVVTMYPVYTSVEFLQRLAINVESHRPASRLKRGIVVDSSHSFLLDDLTQIWPDFPTMTFELKPKWGFKPDSPYITSNTNTKRTYCRFCMHSHLRGLAQTNFCPLDLYSMDRSRIKKSLNLLLKENPLTKTLKVTINGKQVPLGFDMVDQQNLLFSVFMVDSDNTLMQDILENIIVQDPILHILKQLQMNMDELDVEGIFFIYQQHQTLPTNDIKTWEQIVTQYQQRCQEQTSFESEKLEEQRQRIYEYVLSMTFKDCSLMINVTPLKSNNHISSSSSSKTIKLKNGLSFQYDIKVIDTDLKSVDKIPYWFELDQSIVKHAVQTKFQKYPCL